MSSKIIFRVRYALLICWPVGYITLAVSRLLRNKLSDFERGFCDGFALVLIGVGFMYMVWCLVKGHNPNKFDKHSG
jgi:hypothetical protein